MSTTRRLCLCTDLINFIVKILRLVDNEQSLAGELIKVLNCKHLLFNPRSLSFF